MEQKDLLRAAEIAYFVFLDLFKDAGRKLSLIFYLFVFDVNQGNEEA